jgi:hypothetical protein
MFLLCEGECRRPDQIHNKDTREQMRTYDLHNLITYMYNLPKGLGEFSRSNSRTSKLIVFWDASPCRLVDCPTFQTNLLAPSG